ncbi:DUF4198 domain-containing protein [Desulfobacca acetoxidans]|uniref:Nickel transport complex protein, NikM subunit, transmembrane n=1 Tax=Desulfobacca acetoxidans (strain ATCC 700848 / DSM 11109 / ASRB2) TaxID=880072 RepID=F2NJ06_DESAR|nr:DUF4198 domain-containing protein [Desulfobacca acetoxidans]AEB07964.1 Nickel transport complex protein, NikM subunit, transmembrane [Desulfobacca acetoxidans DSM 11109]
MKRFILFLIISIMLTSVTQAHYLWVERQDNAYLIARGLLPDKLYPYAPTSIKEIKAFDTTGKLLTGQRLDGADTVRLQTKSAPAMVTVLAEWGYRVNTPTGKEFLTKQEAIDKGLKVEEAFFSTQIGKTIFAFGEALTKPVGLKFEAVPLKDPLTLAPEEELPVQFFFQGAPLTGCRVRVGKVKDWLETDSQGVVRVKLPEPGYQAIFASHRTPAPNRADIDYVLYTTFLTFQKK